MDEQPNNFHFLNNLEAKPSGSRSIVTELKNVNLIGIMSLIFVLFVLFVAVAVIRDLSGLGSWFGSTVVGWFREATIDPSNRQGFARFLILALTACFIGLLVFFLGRKQEGQQ
jgi:Na+-transporting NADH:ubiquinone oxidoreductase subunit NqrD